MDILFFSSFIPASSSDACRDDRQQLITFMDDRDERINIRELHLADKFQPGARFTKLLKANAELVDEIPARFRRLNFSVIGERRRAAAGQLERDVLTNRGSWQAFGPSTYRFCKRDKAVLEVVFRHDEMIAGSIRGMLFNYAQDRP